MGKIATAIKKARKESKAAVTNRDDYRKQHDDPGASGPHPQTPSGIITHQKGASTPGNVYDDHIDVQPGISPKLVVFHDPESLAAEHFKVLRSQIVYPDNGKTMRSVLITSAMDQEGKTMVACNLAVSIAQGLDPYALLIDGDIRRPDVHHMLGLSPRSGLSEYLSGTRPLSDFLIKSPLNRLTVLPAGRTVRNPAELLTSSKMKHLLEEARERYPDRFVIVDSPPVNLAAETLTLAQHVDAVIFVVRYGYSQKEVVEEALERLGKEKVLGIVFNGFENPPRKYSYYKYKYYYGYGTKRRR